MGDVFVPTQQADEFARLLITSRRFGNDNDGEEKVQFIPWNGATHTHASIQASMSGDDTFYQILLDCIQQWTLDDDHDVEQQQQQQTENDYQLIMDDDEKRRGRRGAQQQQQLIQLPLEEMVTPICPDLLVKIGCWIMPM